MNNFLAVYMQTYQHLLGARADTFKELFRFMGYKEGPLTIVETGCARTPGNWQGDGQSTVLFDQYVNCAGGSFYSVDISAEAVTAARGQVSPRTSLVLNDSVAYLAKFGRPIDVLYLDSFDYDKDNPLPSSLHHIYELCAAQRWLRHGSLVMIDDSFWEMGACVGKGKLVAEYMKAVGATHVASGYQDLWLLL